MYAKTINTINAGIMIKMIILIELTKSCPRYGAPYLLMLFIISVISGRGNNVKLIAKIGKINAGNIPKRNDTPGTNPPKNST